MKKLFLVGALAASMAFSSSALAAVNYGQDNGIAATLNEDGTVSVTTTLAGDALTSGQLTILVLDKDIDEVITNEETGETTKVTFDDSNIMYIDQASVTDNAVFENMGLLNPNEAETAYIRVGGDLGINIMTTELALVEEEEGTEIVFGDMDGSYDASTMSAPGEAITAVDASAILALQAGGTVEAGAVYKIGALLTDSEGNSFVFGDMDGSYDASTMSAPGEAITAVDASAILALQAGGTVEAGAAYAIDDIVTVVTK